MSSRRSRSGGMWIGKTRQPVVEVLAEAARLDLVLEVAGWSPRRRARRPDSARLSPTGRISPSCSTRSSFACSAGVVSAISSRKSVPPSATSKSPLRSPTAPVKAPRRWPNSSLSRRPFGQRGAVDRDEELVAARAGRMDRARHQLLAGAGLARRPAPCVGVGATRPTQLEHLADRGARRRRSRVRHRRLVALAQVGVLDREPLVGAAQLLDQTRVLARRGGTPRWRA